MLHEKLTSKIIRIFYKVNNTLGYGFLEKVYENAMIIELQNIGCKVEQQKNIKVFYQGLVVGDYYADLLVDNFVLLELKTAKHLCKDHEYQLINYLKSNKIEIGLLLNFGKNAEYKRKIFTNDRK
jgi:GxxExxY protein